MSTVGVDIGDWVFEKKIRGQSSYGQVVFRYCITSVSIFCSFLYYFRIHILQFSVVSLF